MATTTTPEPKEGPMFAISCPCKCGETVLATDAGFAATTVAVAACPALKVQGITSTEVRKSLAYSLAVPTTGLRHRDGLVAF